tara:strand:- start:598 stop:741 length:144 start_codon:yes stop_codon:yes gene_type:complete
MGGHLPIENILNTKLLTNILLKKIILVFGKEHLFISKIGGSIIDEEY